MALDKRGLFGRRDLKRKLVDLGGDQVWMRELSVGESRRLKKKYKAADPDPDTVERAVIALIAHALENEDGTPMFGEAEIPEAIAILEAGSHESVLKLAKAFADLHALTEAAIKEELGNSGAIRNEPSSSGSPASADGSTSPS